MSLIIPAVHFRQRKMDMYIAAVPIGALDGFSVDIWNPKSVTGRRGYQRKPDEYRIKNIAKYFERRNAIMPVAGLLNVREKGRLKFRDGELTIPDGVDVWVVDMQHRLKGLVRAKDEGVLRPESFRFSVVITEGLGQVDEAVQFYVINTKAKKNGRRLDQKALNRKQQGQGHSRCKAMGNLCRAYHNRAEQISCWKSLVRDDPATK